MLDRAVSPSFVWWKHGSIYQVYPRSFQDMDGDGVGDLAGVIARLDYLVDLGIDAIWLSPIFASPMADFGYDVADHTAVDPLFGDLATFDELTDKAHARGLRVILDFIPNHVSDQHPWFQQSRAGRDNPRRDWFIWRDPAPGGGPPNNWQSEFGGPAWTFDDASGQFYYHAFLTSQPDLNWRNPDVVSAMLGVLRFWLDRGVDGFRVDAIHHLFEAEDLADNPLNPRWREGSPPVERHLRAHTVDQPQVHAAIAAMRAVVDSYGGERVLIGEAYLPIERLMAYYGVDLGGFHLPFNFHLMSTAWTPAALDELVLRYDTTLPAGGWPNWVLGNHDRSRLASRVGAAQARVAAMLLFTLRGTPTIYQGDELGMTDVPVAPERVRDPWELNLPGLGLGRDPVRTPMPWCEAANAGFSVGDPWLPLAPDWERLHVAGQRARRQSIWNLYHQLLTLRRRQLALLYGDYAPFAVTASVFAYERRFGEERLLVALELSGRPSELPTPGGELLLATDGRPPATHAGGVLKLPANTGMLLRLNVR